MTKVRRSKVIRASPREVHRLAEEFEQVLRPVVERPESERTLQATSAEWLQDERKHTLVSWRKHEQALRSVILPALGVDTLLRDLRPEAIQAVYDRLTPRRCRHIHMTVRALMRYAVRKGWIQDNPMAQVMPPRLLPASSLTRSARACVRPCCRPSGVGGCR